MVMLACTQQVTQGKLGVRSAISPPAVSSRSRGITATSFSRRPGMERRMSFFMVQAWGLRSSALLQELHRPPGGRGALVAVTTQFHVDAARVAHLGQGAKTGGKSISPSPNIKCSCTPARMSSR